MRFLIVLTLNFFVMYNAYAQSIGYCKFQCTRRDNGNVYLDIPANIEIYQSEALCLMQEPPTCLGVRINAAVTLCAQTLRNSLPKIETSHWSDRDLVDGFGNILASTGCTKDLNYDFSDMPKPSPVNIPKTTAYPKRERKPRRVIPGPGSQQQYSLSNNQWEQLYPLSVHYTLSSELAKNLTHAISLDLIEIDNKTAIITGIGVSALAVMSSRQGVRSIIFSNLVRSRGFLPGVALSLITSPLLGSSLPMNHVREKPWIFPELPLDQQEYIIEHLPAVVEIVENFNADLNKIINNYNLEVDSNCQLNGVSNDQTEMIKSIICPYLVVDDQGIERY